MKVRVQTSIVSKSKVIISLSSSSSQVEEPLALLALQQRPPLLLSVMLLSPAQPNLQHQTLTLLQSSNLSLQLPAPLSPNLSRRQPQPRTPPRTPQPHLVLPQHPLQHLFQTGSRQLFHSRPGPQEARTSGRRRRSGRTAWQSKFLNNFSLCNVYNSGLLCS